MGDSVIRKTRLSGNIGREQTCPDKRIVSAHRGATSSGTKVRTIVTKAKVAT